MNWSRFLPRTSADYRGSRFSLYLLPLMAIISTVRSLIHIFAVDGAANIVAMFAQWGASQLMLALLYWLVIMRYRFLAPLMLAVVCIEQILRIGVGLLKPIEVDAPPPAQLGSTVPLPLILTGAGAVPTADVQCDLATDWIRDLCRNKGGE